MTEKTIYQCKECFLIFEEWIKADDHERNSKHKVEKKKESES